MRKYDSLIAWEEKRKKSTSPEMQQNATIKTSVRHESKCISMRRNIHMNRFVLFPLTNITHIIKSKRSSLLS